ncbi:Cyclic di-GMP phosphodiesterase response regulator RpfG [Rubripirellula tenax]|uniref:Cyclic di-GMP phosphodiesterase response regulator RpfG n=1 Tax=Rubripirellula tenax TaxID=2528015 RepID=A0A5C6EEH0_9BACT|nr:HD domain-containing phosphohydrolase [Rubripirellula tenax]TWU47228.1 Cyclic di-GMP phosphodiesterase response regulator RpfG [Rubripirellula tenax]
MGLEKVSVSIDQLAIGVTCSQPIVSDRGILLLGAKTCITQQVITGLRERGIDYISVDPSDLALLRGKPKAVVTPKPARPKDSKWDPSRPVKEMLVSRHGESLSTARAEYLANRMTAAKKQFELLQHGISRGALHSLSDFDALSENFVHSMVDDHDQTVGSMSDHVSVDPIGERSVRMAVLGMSVACEMGLTGKQTLEVGMAGLLHDLGLYVLDPDLWCGVDLQSESDRWEYQKHPLLTARCIGDAIQVSPIVCIAIEQVHEQFDGSGFPRGVKGQRIHLYARILNVVDAYLQLTSPTAHRGPVLPHDAMGVLLHRAAKGIFDPQVIKAFLSIESLFPLGSHVELSTGQLARVIRRPQNGFSLPLVKSLEGELIDLEKSSIAVVRPRPTGGEETVRLSQEWMQACQWNPAQDSFVV